MSETNNKGTAWLNRLGIPSGNNVIEEYVNELFLETGQPPSLTPLNIQKRTALGYLLKTEKEKELILKFTDKDILDTYVTKHISNVGTKIGRNLSGKNSTDLDFLSAEYDSINRKIESINSGLVILDAATIFTGCAPLIGAVAVFSTVLKVAAVAVGQYEKYKELNYISSACLGFVSALMKNIGEMTIFYSVLDNIKQNGELSEEIGLELNKIVKSPIWDVIQDNLWKFLIFLISQIEFSLETLGEKQYMFWNLFLSTVTFEKNEALAAKYTFKYTKQYCGEDIDNPICNNYNDALMRLLEEKIISLFRSINTNRSKTTSTALGSLVKGFGNVTGLRTLGVTDFINIANKAKASIPLFKTKIMDNFKNTYSNRSGYELVRSKTEDFFKTLSRFAEELSNQPTVVSKSGAEELSNQPTVVSKSGFSTTFLKGGGIKFKKTKRGRNFNKRTKKIYGESRPNLRQSGGAWLDWLRSRNSYQVYREMLREYTIMTANVAVATTDYVLHYNKCILFAGSDNYKKAYKEYFEKDKDKLNMLTQALQKIAGESQKTQQLDIEEPSTNLDASENTGLLNDT